jgi:hypothetical protein
LFQFPRNSESNESKIIKKTQQNSKYRFREKKLSKASAGRLKKTASDRNVQNVFLTQLGNNEKEAEEPLIPDSLPMATAAERDEKIPLPASFSSSEPAFMLERSFKKKYARSRYQVLIGS